MNDVCYRKITLAHQNHDFMDITAYREGKADSTMVTCLSQTSEIMDLVLRCFYTRGKQMSVLTVLYTYMHLPAAPCKIYMTT